MSKDRSDFQAEMTKGDKASWETAFKKLNALNMEEMLESLAAIGEQARKRLHDRRHAYKGSYFMARIEYAMTVVDTREIPLVAPGDLLQTGQVGSAATFLKKAAPASPRIKLKTILFTVNNVARRLTGAELVSKAREILSSQGNGFSLEAHFHSNDLVYSEQIYLLDQLDDLSRLASSALTIPTNALAVIMCKFRQNVGVHGLANTYTPSKPFAFIDADNPNPDRATLLHEAGHFAGLPHVGETPKDRRKPIDVGDVTNFMAEPQGGVLRNTMTVTQGEALAGAFFAMK